MGIPEKVVILPLSAARDRSRLLASVNATLKILAFIIIVFNVNYNARSESLDFVLSEPSNMHSCRAFPFALAGLSCTKIPVGRETSFNKDLFC